MDILTKLLSFLMLLCISLSSLAQGGFSLPKNKKKDKISFKLVNNLPVIAVEINGTELSFILDTGVKSSILFSLEDTDSLELRNTTPVQLQGLGEGGKVDALKSQNNKVKVGKAVDMDHTLFVVFDKSLNFSPRMGIPIHGILGNDFFQNFIVKINYVGENIVIYDQKNYSLKKCGKCEDLDLTFVNSKPYISLNTVLDGKKDEITLLVDSGSSDVLWLFDERGFIKETPKNYFQDFLGMGLSGNIFGKRTKLPEVLLGGIRLTKVNAAFPSEEAINKARNFKERDGSVGGGFLSRFTITLDYGNGKIRFKKNGKFNDPFNYNMSGLTIQHEGMELVKKEKHAKVNYDRMTQDQESSSLNITSISVTTEYELSLMPRYIIVDVRADSPAALAGIVKGDEMLSVNGKPSYQFDLSDLIDMFSSDEGKRITIEVKRGDYVNKVKFYLKSLL